MWSRGKKGECRCKIEETAVNSFPLSIDHLSTISTARFHKEHGGTIKKKLWWIYPRNYAILYPNKV
jgi:hypothetical protein